MTAINYNYTLYMINICYILRELHMNMICI